MSSTHEDFVRTEPVKESGNRAFGWVFTAVFLIVGLWPLVRGGAPRWWSVVIGGLVLLITVAAPALLTVPNRLWLRFGLLLNRIMSPVMLGVLFYLVVTPVGLLMRRFNRDALRLRADTAVESYWIRREPPGPQPGSMSNQF